MGKPFKIQMKDSYYFQDAEKHSMDIPYLEFHEDGTITLEGSDTVGDFEFTGELKNGKMYLTKQYIGQHAVYYVGNLIEGVVKLTFGFEGNWEDLASAVDDGNVMAVFEFAVDPYSMYLKDEDMNVDLYMDSDNVNSCGKFRGLAVLEGNFTIVKIKMKCEVKLISADWKKKLGGKYKPNKQLFVIKGELPDDD